MNNSPAAPLKDLIHVIRGHRVMLDEDLAKLYGVSTKQLNQQVRRNMNRFPSDFMFQLSDTEEDILKSQFVTSSCPSKISRHGGRRKSTRAFTEQGVAMLSTVLRSERAIQINIMIMRLFVWMRGAMAGQSGLIERIDVLEQKCDDQFRLVFEAIQALMEPPDDPPAGRIGFQK